jgi:hypothetical protein
MQKKILNEEEVETTSALSRMEIWRDDDSENPRKWSNTFTLWTGNSRYLSSDKDAEDPRTVEGTKVEEAKYKKGLFAIPLYAYIHSGMALSLHPFSCKWDSGVIGFLYCDKEKFKKENGLKRFNAKRALEIAEGEISTLQDFIDGNVFGYTIERRDSPDGEWKFEDSCGGWYGFEDMLRDNGAFKKGMVLWTKSPNEFPKKVEYTKEN